MRGLNLDLSMSVTSTNLTAELDSTDMIISLVLKFLKLYKSQTVLFARTIEIKHSGELGSYSEAICRRSSGLKFPILSSLMLTKMKKKIVKHRKAYFLNIAAYWHGHLPTKISKKSYE